MFWNKRLQVIVPIIAIPVFFITVFLFIAGEAAARQVQVDLNPAEIDGGSNLTKSAEAANLAPTSLAIANISARFLPVDHNEPSSGPNVYVVQAVITNTGSTEAAPLNVMLDYNEGIASNWILQSGEDPLRTVESLGPGEAYYAYWLASYPLVENATHQYTVTAWAANAPVVSTAENYYGDPQPGKTVQTIRNLGTGNTGITQVEADIVIGVAYSITVAYDLGSSPDELTFSPVGNNDFDAGTTRLLASSVTFTNTISSDTLLRENQLYYTSVPTLPSGAAEVAIVTYDLLPLTPNETYICPYMSAFFDPNQKYDNGYCQGTQIIPIEGDISMQLSKEVDRNQVLQGEELNYTLHYTNDGTAELQSVWIWDEVDPAIASIIANTTSPSPTIDSDSLVAWSLGTIPPLGQLGSTGTLTVTVHVDGDGQDLPDGQAVVNDSFFGIDPGSLPQRPAFTSTVTSIVQAPVMSIEKSDGQTNIGSGEELTYTIQVFNAGSANATDIVIIDTLPSEVSLTGPTSPPYGSNNGGVLTWGQAELGDLAPGESLTITIPTLVDPEVATFTILTNTADLNFANDAGYNFDEQTAEDTTTVLRRAGFVEGYAFDDTNGNGVFDSGESGLAGVTISLPDAVTPTMVTTAGDGYYWFRVESEGIVVASSDLPPGYFRTTPGAAHPNVVFDETQRADFGFAANASSFGTVFGTVFEDTNRNGIFDTDEGAISGVQIDSADAVTQTVFTNALGQYTLKYSATVNTLVNETNPTGFVSTTPDQINVSVSTGSDNNSPYDFGDFAGIRITGQVFDDANVNGINDGESGLAGAIISAGGVTMTTASDGLFDLVLPLPGGPVTLTEQDPAGYVSTVAIPGSGMTWIDANTLSIASPIAGTVYSGSEFGDVLANQAITISGSVWDDNGAGGGTAVNGQRDGTEPGLEGALVSLSSGASQLTGPDGSYELLGPAQTPITLTEVNPAGYVSTNAVPGNGAVKVDDDSIFITAQAGGFASSGNNFGDVAASQAVTITGTVWNDNGAGGGIAMNGLRDGAEPGLAGVSVSLSSGMSGLSGSDGSYKLYGPPGQVITLTANNLAGYYSSGSIAGNDAVVVDSDTISINALTAESSSNGNLFGDVMAADLAISKADDPDPVASGDIVTYTLTYTNYGPAAAQDVTIKDALDENVVFGGVISTNPALPPVDQNGQLLTWNLGTLQNGDSGTIVYYVTVNPGTIGSVSNEAQIASSQTPDQDDTNNTSIENTSIGSPNLATIYGYVFEDSNGNGLWDDGESALEGVSVTLDGIYTKTTDANGLYSFLTGITGTRSILETDPDNYFSTTPNEVRLAVILGESYRVDFGDAPDDSGFASLFGTVFEDKNSNGLWDKDEVGLSGVTLTLDETKTTLSDIYGRYTFSTTVAGSHTVVETDLPNYFSTTPNSVTEDIVLNTGTRIDFGDVLAKDATCDADSFEEDDVYADANTIDLGVKQSHDFCDDAVDWTKLSVSLGDVYTIKTSSYGQRADTFVEVYAADGTTRLAANDDSGSTTDFSSELVFQAATTGDVLIKTTNRVGITGFHTDYDIQVEVEPINMVYLPIIINPGQGSTSKSSSVQKIARPSTVSQTRADWSPLSMVGPLGVITHSCPDVYEIDDSWPSAGPIVSGVPQLHSFDSDPVLYAADKDFVSFTLFNFQEISFSVTSNTGTSALLEVYDANGRALNLSGVDSLVVKDLPPGNYYLSASPTSLDFGCSEATGYTLEADFKSIFQVFLPVLIR